jgi:hypothetical protein
VGDQVRGEARERDEPAVVRDRRVDRIPIAFDAMRVDGDPRDRVLREGRGGGDRQRDRGVAQPPERGSRIHLRSSS